MSESTAKAASSEILDATTNTPPGAGTHAAGSEAASKPFQFGEGPCELGADKDCWKKWPSQWRDAYLYRPSEELREALALAVNLKRPILLTGRPGCGKTTAAYWAALMLGRRPAPDQHGVHHVQIRSDTTTARIKYEFDAVRYYRDAQLSVARLAAREKGEKTDGVDASWSDTPARRRSYIRPGPLWTAFKDEGHAVLLLDEIDKAPRDVPNDLLRELDRFEFEVPELRPVEGADREGELQASAHVAAKGAGPGSRGVDVVWREGGGQRFLCIITSNGERDLPDAFLRRCLHQYIEMTDDEMKEIAAQRLEASDGELHRNTELRDFAVGQFLALAAEIERHGRRKPGLGELLTWLRAIDLSPDQLDKLRKQKHVSFADLPCLQALLKHPDDVRLAKGKS
ncbi:AAA family ATPase [Sorangium sp. So ce204]|uniref:AAA family ATPase n=1 Tax=Sorangium sp. So ce204 TaxID=3133288 RepID=UPI003F5DB61F